MGFVLIPEKRSGYRSSMTITMPSPVWTPEDEDLDDDDVEFEDPFAVPVTHPTED
jgi:hypothetical protein